MAGFWMLVLLAAFASAAPPKYRHQISKNLQSTELESRVVEKLYHGCYQGDVLGFLTTTSDVAMRVEVCLEHCRLQSFTYAGLKNGRECYCGNTLDSHVEANCTTSCTGNSLQQCGAADALSIYHVNKDRRYLGCFSDSESDRDLGYKQWDGETGHTALQCVERCRQLGHKYAGLQAGDCYCGANYGTHGPAEEVACHTHCHGHGEHPCGAELVNAVYHTERLLDLTSNDDFDAVNLYDESEKQTGVHTSLYTLYPGLRTLVTKKLVIYSGESVKTPSEDPCNLDCYSVCGTIPNNADIQDVGDHVTIRAFHLRLSELPDYVNNAKTVHIYAQTVVIDTSIVASYSLLIRSTRLLVDRTTVISINVTAPDLVLDTEQPLPDLLLQKLSYTCARILLDTRNNTDANVAFSIMHEIAHSPAGSVEQQAFSDMVRSYMAEVVGIDRSRLHYVPVYTKSHLAQVLDTYYDRISIYQHDLERLEDDLTSDADFLRYAEEMLLIYTSTDVTEALTGYEDSLDAVGVANATYLRMELYYNMSRVELDRAREDFERGIQDAKIQLIKEMLWDFTKGVGLMAVGGVTYNPAFIVAGVSSVIEGTDGMPDVLAQLTAVIYQVDEMAKMMDANLVALQNMKESYDGSSYIQDVEMAVQLQVSLVQWENMKHYSTLILSDERVLDVAGSTPYARALMNLCNWGQALTRAMVDLAESSRQAMQQRQALDVKLEQQSRVTSLLDQLRQDLTLRPSTLAAMRELTLDVQNDLNQVLLTFCQAYFFETLDECSASIKPSFGDSLTQLLLKINIAQRDDLLVEGSPSTVNRTLDITDTDTDPDCIDATVCPINYFRKHRMLYYTVTTDEPELADLDKYRVAEIHLRVEGALPTASQEYLQVRIESTGDFQGRADGQTYNFITKPLLVAYEYSLRSGHVSLYADVYNPVRHVFNHVTPFTSWLFWVYEDRSADIDLSHVTRIRMTLTGSAMSNERSAKTLKSARLQRLEHAAMPGPMPGLMPGPMPGPMPGLMPGLMPGPMPGPGFLEHSIQETAPSEPRSYEDELQRVLDKLYIGCHHSDSRDQPVHTGDPYMTAHKCVQACRVQVFKYAALQNGTDCYCSNSEVRTSGATCSIQCPGDTSQSCGGPDSAAIYAVSADERYAGCYRDTETRDLPVTLTSTATPLACLDSCMREGYRYAGLRDSECRCGNQYGTHGPAAEQECLHFPCQGYGQLYCGGTEASAIYRTLPAYEMTALSENTATKVYDSTGQVHGIHLSFYTMFPAVTNLVTKSLVIYSLQEVRTPGEAQCSQDCYTPCGQIENHGEFSQLGGDVVLRFFHLKLSDLHKFVGEVPGRVLVYAQTIVIDASLTVQYSLLLRATSILIDRSQGHQISVATDALELQYDLDLVKYGGPAADLLHQKQSYTCARILLDTGDREHLNTAWSILHDITQSQASSQEQQAFIDMVTSFAGEVSGLNRHDIHYVPLYTKSHLAEVLAIYSDNIWIYKTDMDRLQDQTTSDEDFLEIARGLNDIYASTDVTEALQAFEDIMQAVGRSNATYTRMYLYYNVSRQELEHARLVFEQGMEEALTGNIKTALMNFVRGALHMTEGIMSTNYEVLLEGVGEVFAGTEGMGQVMQELAYMVAEMEALVAVADDNIAKLNDMSEAYDPSKYQADVQLATSLQVSLVQWHNMKALADIVLSDGRVLQVGGAGLYTRCFMDLCNWGVALTRAMIERAEVMRLAMQKRSLLDAKLEQQQRVEDLLDQLQQDSMLRQTTLATMMEQTYDVRLDLNEALLMFCQAYFYEKLEECHDGYKPSFGGSMTELLLKINAAQRDDLLVESPPSTASRYVNILDSDTDPACNDALQCPLNYLRNNRVLYFQLSPDHPDLNDLYNYRVAEIVLEVDGATSNTDNTWLQFRIECSGEFQSRSPGGSHSFITTPLSLAYEYDIITGHISIHADVYDPYRGVYNHMTPYTTWVMSVYEPRSADVDLSAVTAVRLRLDGSANIHSANNVPNAAH